jgi:CheY-like chemotaxis protein
MSIKILSVDDSKTIRTQLTTTIRQLFNEDVHVLDAEDGEEAIVQLEDNSDIKLIFLDINMPGGMPGDEFLEYVKFKEEYKDIRVIVASTEDSDDMISQMLYSGADGYIIKPISAQEIIRKVFPFLQELNLSFAISDEEINDIVYPKEDIENIKVLAVDDSKTIRKMYKKHIPEAFEKYIEVLEAENGKQALEVLNDNPDVLVVFLDVNMPVMDGYQFLRTVRLMPQFEKLKVVMATSESDKEVVRKMLQAGANSYLIKPFGLDTMTKTLNHIFEDDGIEGAIVECSKKDDKPKQRESDVFKVMTVDDSSFTREMLKKQLPALFKNSVDVIEAVDGKDAFKQLSLHPDVELIFLDITMPKMDGISFLRTMKAMPTLRDKRVVMVTSNSSETIVDQMLKSGANAYIIKPLTVNAIKKSVFPIVESDFGYVDIIKSDDDLEVGRSIKIMTVDDSKLIRTMFRKSLPMMFKNSVKIVEAEDGKQAIQKLGENKDIDLIFLDVNMPNMDGKTFLKTIKLMEGYKDISIIMATTETDKELMQDVTMEGVNGYLIKPFNAQSIKDAISKIKDSLGNDIELS